MNGMIAWWARNPVAANLLMVAIIIAGGLSFTRLDREVFPSMSFNGANIYVRWEGASPQDVEQQLILRIEEAISDVDGVKRIESTAYEERASVNVEGEEGIDTTAFINEIKSRVDGISTFPEDAFEPIVSQWRNRQPAMFIALYGDLEPRERFRLARELRDELAVLPKGSPLVDTWGVLNEEVSIEVSEEALQRYGLRFIDVANAIRATSLNISGGAVRTDTGSVRVSVRNLADTEEEFGKIVVRQQQDGSVVRVRDLATVVDGFVERKAKRRMNGKPVVTLAVQSPDKLNIVELSNAVDAWIAEKNKELEGVAELYTWFDFSDVYDGRMRLVSSNAVVGLLLVLIVLLLFLRPSVAFWVTVGIAIAFAGAFIFMPIVGISLNMLSLFAFLLVIGVVVDDAIIVGEGIHQTVESGEARGLDAAIIGAQMFAKPVLFAVLTTMIAFLPWIFVDEGASQFTRNITYTVIFALAFSLVESFLILPAHLAHLKPQNKDGFYYRLQRGFSEGMTTFADRIYRPLVKLGLRLRYWTVATYIGFLMISIALMAQGWISFKFFPEPQGSFVQLSVRLPEEAPWSRTLELFDVVEGAGDRMRDKLNTDELEFVKAVYVGAEEGSIDAYMTIVPADQREQSTKTVAEMFREELGDIPDAEEINIAYTLGDDQPDLNFGLVSDDLEALRVAVVDLQEFVTTLPGTYDIRNTLQSATPEIRIGLKPGAERFGLTLGDVSQQIRRAFFGVEVQRLPRDGQDVRVMVRYPAETREDLSSLSRMRIRTADGREVPLSAVADLSFGPSLKRIDRYERTRSARVTGQLREGADRAAIMAAYREQYAVDFTTRHPEVALQQRGDAAGQDDFLAEAAALYAVALFAMYTLLAIAFNSYWQPVLVMSAIPFGFMGAAYGHWLFGIDFTMFSFFGVGAAAGVVVNDNLVLIDNVNRLREKGEGAFSALVKSGVMRFRPIVLTSFTTFVGLLPIIFERSTDAEFLKPTVVALACGVAFAMFVTLFFVPAMYAVGADIARFYRWAWTGEKQARVGFGKSLDTDYAGGEPSARPAE
ncbi:MAG: efflux RND transporter permease subunit [Pseudomonadota bacterium]